MIDPKPKDVILSPISKHVSQGTVELGRRILLNPETIAECGIILTGCGTRSEAADDSGSVRHATLWCDSSEDA